MNWWSGTKTLFCSGYTENLVTHKLYIIDIVVWIVIKVSYEIRLQNYSSISVGGFHSRPSLQYRTTVVVLYVDVIVDNRYSANDAISWVSWADRIQKDQDVATTYF